MTDAIIVAALRAARYGLAVAWLVAGSGCGRGPAGAAAPPISPAAIESALAAAEEFASTGDTEGATAILERLMEQAPQECRALELSGRILYLRGLQAASSGGGGGGGEGTQAAAAGFIAQAHDRYLAAIECHAAPPAGLHQSAGEIAAAAGRLDGALSHFRAAGALDPANPKHPLYEAQMLMRLGRTDEARRAIDRVLALDPGEPFAHATLAASSLEARDCAVAIAHIEAARRLAPGDLALRIHEASIRRRCDQPRQGLELLVGLDEATRSQEIVTAEIAECFRALGQPASAAAAWEARYRLNPRDPSAWQSASRAADLHLEAGNREAARWWQSAAVAARLQESSQRK